MMARALLALVNNIESLSWIQNDTLSSWFALHLSNFEFKWKWQEWADIPNLPNTHGKYLFLRALLEKLVRLSYHDRIMEITPDWAKPLMPSVPQCCVNHEIPDETVELTYNSLLKLIQDRTSVEDVLDFIKAQEHLSLAKTRKLFLQCLMMAGSKTLSHAVILIERYLSILQELHPKEDLECRQDTVQIIAELWKSSAQHFQFIVERLLHYRIVSSPAIVQWVFHTSEAQISDPNVPFDSVLSSCLIWPLLHTTLSQACNFPVIVEAKYAEALKLNDVEKSNKLKSSLASLEAEYKQVLYLCLHGLTSLPKLIAADQGRVQATTKICDDMLQAVMDIFGGPVLTEVTKTLVENVTDIDQSKLRMIL